LILMPRGTFKSSIVTVGLSIQYLLNDPNGRILIDSETFSKSKAFLSEIKGHLEDNEKLREIFYVLYECYPDDKRKHDLWSDSQINIAARKLKRKEASISCAGIDVTKNGMHYDLIIADDLHSEKNITTADQLQQVKDHYKLAFSLLDPGMSFVVIGTRWHHLDLYSHILEEEIHRFNVIKRKAIFGEENELLFPERLTHEFLEDVKKTQGSYIFSCQYLNEPVDDETAVFKRSYFQPIEWELVKDRPINWFVAIDPSADGQYADYGAFILAGMDYERNLYVREVFRAKMNYKAIIDLAFEWYNRFSPRRMAIETVATQKQIEYMLNDEQKLRGVWMPIQFIKSRTKSKEERITALAPYYEFARIYHVKGIKQLGEFEEELANFPKGTHDDMIDALATILEIATPPSGSNIGNREETRSHKRIKATMKPRSPVTGI
jgi:predicted phage terminase large subunit-like protein